MGSLHSVNEAKRNYFINSVSRRRYPQLILTQVLSVVGSIFEKSIICNPEAPLQSLIASGNVEFVCYFLNMVAVFILEAKQEETLKAKGQLFLELHGNIPSDTKVTNTAANHMNSALNMAIPLRGALFTADEWRFYEYGKFGAIKESEKIAISSVNDSSQIRKVAGN